MSTPTVGQDSDSSESYGYRVKKVADQPEKECGEPKFLTVWRTGEGE